MIYPSSLPGPMPGSIAPRPRRAVSTIEGPLQQRARQRDAAGLASQYTYTYTPDEMAAWLVWYRDTLLDGRRWFAHALPGPNGLMQRVVRYRSVQQQLLGVGIYRVSASFEQRGRSRLLPPNPPNPAYGWQVKSSNSGSVSFTDGNQLATWAVATGEDIHARTDVVLEGKRYVEMQLVSKADNIFYQAFGITLAPNTDSTFFSLGRINLFCQHPGYGGTCGFSQSRLNVSGSTINDVSYGAGPGDIVGIAYDASTRKFWLSINNTWVAGGDPAAGTGELGTAAEGSYYFFSGGYACIAPHAAPVFRIHQAASNQAYPAPVGFVPYQS